MQHAARPVFDATPLWTEDLLAGLEAERRVEPRVDCEEEARFRLPVMRNPSWSRGVAVNLTASGGSFLVDGAWRLVERIESDEFVTIDVELTGNREGGEPLPLRGEVVWVQPDGGGAEGVDRIGVRFRDLSVRQASRLSELIDSRRSA